jgi:hypothetical protein
LIGIKPPSQEEEVFIRAIELALEDRAAFLRTACGDDEALWKSVEQLLEAHESGCTLVDRPCDEAAVIGEALGRMLPVQFRGKEG